MGLFLPQRWRRQPQGPQRIDWSSPHARGLIACALPGSGPVHSSYEMVRGQRLSYGNPYNSSATALGMRSWSSQQYEGPVGTTLNNAFKVQTDRIETAAVFSTTSTTASSTTNNGGRLTFFGNSATSNIGFGVLDVGGALKPNFRAGSLDDVTVGGFEGLTADVTGSTTIVQDRIYTGFTVMTPDGYTGSDSVGAEMAVGLNGRVEGTGRYEQYFNDENLPIYPVAYFHDVGRAWHTFLYAVWKRARSEAERLDWHANPWQLFAPQRATFFSLPIASGPTLSAATVIDISSTSVRPRVTITI